MMGIKITFKALSICIVFIISSLLASGQNEKRSVVKYEFSQIDSLIDDNIKRLEFDSILIVHTVWNVGAQRFDKSDQLVYDNPFYILFYFKNNGKAYLKKVNNLGESDITTERRLNQEFDFVKENIEVMKDEELTEYSDTTYYADGTFSVRSTHTSHQRLDKILILHRNKEFNYSVRHSFTKNELNFEKRQFQFFEMLKKSSHKWDRRITVE